MNFSIAQTLRLLFAPQHKLSCSWFVWRRLIKGLRVRGNNKSRESGAFLLGYKDGQQARIVDFILYDDLDPHCLDEGIVRFNGQFFSELWTACKQRNLSVVADVHVHPYGEQQSQSDQAHPMISRPGHLALILPKFAETTQISKIGIYRYLGNKEWETLPQKRRKSFFHIGF